MTRDELSLTLTYRPSAAQMVGVVLLHMFAAYLLIGYVVFVVQEDPNDSSAAWSAGILMYGLFGALLLALTLSAFLGVETLQVCDGKMTYEWRVIVCLCRREMRLSEVKSVRGGAVRLPDDEHDTYFVLVESRSSIRFALGVSEKERDWLVEMVNGQLSRT